MTTRDRTKAFLTYRESSMSRRPRKKVGESSANGTGALGGEGDQVSLLGGDQLDSNAASTVERPSWMHFIDEANVDIDTIKSKLRSLEKLHKQRLRVDFDDDDVNSEQQIEILTADITKLPGSAEIHMKDNITNKIALQLQELSGAFRKKQQEYLQSVQRIESRTKDVFGLDEGETAEFEDKGFNSSQMATARGISDLVSQREKEVVAVAKSIEELSGLFKDLSLLIVEQGSILDRIDYNCEQTVHHTEDAVKQLVGANESQKKMRSSGSAVSLSQSTGALENKPKTPRPIRRGSTLHEAIERRDDASLRKLLRSRSKSTLKLLETYDEKGQTPLNAAVARHDLAAIERLLEFMLDHGRPEDVNLKDKHGYSALHCATYESVNEAVLMLLLRFPKIDCTLQNISDNTPLHYFCSNYTDPNVDHILDIFRQKHAQIDAVNQFGETPLHRAVLNRKPMAMVQGLLARQANVNAQTKKLHTPLHYCVNREGADPAVVDLLLRSGASPLLRDSQNITPADAARASGQIQIANRLLNAERVALWLAQIGMSQYLNNFMAQEMLYEVLGDIKAPTLAAMGVTLTGHVMKIMRAVRQLKRAERANDMRKPKKRRSLSASTKVAGGKPSRGSKLGELSHTGNDDAVAGANNNNNNNNSNNDDDGDDDGDENGDENGDDDDDDDDDEAAAGGATENDTTATASTNASNASVIAAAGAAGATASSSADAATSVVAAMANNGGEPRLDNNYVDAGKSGLSTTLTNAIPFAASASLQEQVRGLLAAHPERSCRLVPTDALQIGAPLGQGVSAFVFRGRLLQRRVAIKVFTLAADDTATEQSRQEARVRVENDCLNELSALLALRSPFIVVCRAVTLEPQLSLVLAEHARRSMYHVLHEPEYKLRWRVLLNWASDAAGAVSCMHQHTPPFVHRDLKSLNFLVTDEDGVRLCDFGCARRVVDDNDEELTELKGTAFYAAPEVYFGEAFEKASDVYSLGICFWELVASLIAGVYVRPFSEYNDNAFDFHVFARAAQKHMRPTLSSECPDVMLELVASMLAPTAARRPTAIDIIETLNKATLEYERLRDIWERLEGIGAGQHVPGAPCRPADDIGPPRDNSSTTSKPSTSNTASATPLNVSTPTVEKPARHERLANELGLSPRPPEAVAVAAAESSSGVRAILSPRDAAAAAAAAATASSSSLASSSGSVASSSASSSRPTKPRRRKVRNARTLDRSGTTGSASLREAKHMAVTAEAARSAPDLQQQKKRRTLRATRAEPTSPKSPKSPDVLSLTSGGVPRYSDAVRSVHAKVVQRRASDDQLSSDLSSSPKPSHQSLAKTLASVVTRGRGEMMAGLTKSQTRDVDDSSDSGDKHLNKLTTADVLPSAIALELLDLDDGSAEFGSAVGRSGRIDQVRKLVFGTTDASDTSDGMRDASDDEPEPTVAVEAPKAAPEQASIEESSTDDDLSHGHNGGEQDDDDHADDAPSVVSSSSSKRRPATVASGSRTSARPALKVDRSMSLRVTTSEAAELGAAAAAAVADASAATSQAPDVHSVFKEKRSTELTTTSRSPPPNKGRASGAAAVLAARQRLLRTPSPQPPTAAAATTTTTTTTMNDRQQKVKSMVSTIEQQIAPSVAPVLVKRTTSEQQLAVGEKTEENVH